MDHHANHADPTDVNSQTEVGEDPLGDSGAVLIVDDDDIVRTTSARLLRRAGYEVLEAAGAEEALLCMQQHGSRVSLMLSDVVMPKHNGHSLAVSVRERWPEVEVVLITGYTPVAMDRHGIDTAGFRMLHKPVLDLPAVVAGLIGRGQAA
jgi:two-component system, cell cycle sensor histidine kinase and response regulator CckA